MNNQELREMAFYQRGLKDGALYVQQLVQFQGLHEFVKKSQEYIDAAEDTELRLKVEMQKTSEPPNETM